MQNVTGSRPNMPVAFYQEADIYVDVRVRFLILSIGSHQIALSNRAGQKMKKKTRHILK